ncbi:MAG: class I SAM-dependent methyltransferase [Pseudomonadota bacterium]
MRDLDPSTLPPDADLLPQVAVAMATLAPRLCSDACRDYHAAWGFFRLYGTLPAVARDHEALSSKLSAEVQAGRTRILVSGAADTGIPAYAIAALDAAGVEGAVTVVDLCPTPLAVSTWYAGQRGRSLSTFCGPVESFRGGSVDIVVSHNFLNSIDPADRTNVARAWHDALVPGGRALIFGQVRPEDAARERRFNDARTVEFLEELRGDHARSPHAPLIDWPELEQLARAFAESRISNRLQSEAAFIDPMEAGGLRVVSLTDHAFTLAGTKALPQRRRICLTVERPA